MRARKIKLSALLLASAFAAFSLSACGSIGGAISSSATKTTELAPRSGVNSLLWRASLETLDFMPLDQTDVYGGVIITDWYASPEAPDERFKATVYILDANLRADALKTSIFKQVRNGSGWTDAPSDADTSRQIENASLTRARELHIASVDNG